MNEKEKESIKLSDFELWLLIKRYLSKGDRDTPYFLFTDKMGITSLSDEEIRDLNRRIEEGHHLKRPMSAADEVLFRISTDSTLDLSLPVGTIANTNHADAEDCALALPDLHFGEGGALSALQPGCHVIYGPPASGKSNLAKAIASTNDIVLMDAGDSVATKQWFNAFESEPKALLTLDEIEFCLRKALCGRAAIFDSIRWLQLWATRFPALKEGISSAYFVFVQFIAILAARLNTTIVIVLSTEGVSDAGQDVFARYLLGSATSVFQTTSPNTIRAFFRNSDRSVQHVGWLETTFHPHKEESMLEAELSARTLTERYAQQQIVEFY